MRLYIGYQVIGVPRTGDKDLNHVRIRVEFLPPFAPDIKHPTEVFVEEFRYPRPIRTLDETSIVADHAQAGWKALMRAAYHMDRRMEQILGEGWRVTCDVTWGNKELPYQPPLKC